MIELKTKQISPCNHYNIIFSILLDCYDDFEAFYIYNNKAASRRLKQKLKVLLEKTSDIRRDILDTRKERNEFGYKIPRRKRKNRDIL